MIKDAVIIDGKKISRDVIASLKDKSLQLKERLGRPPALMSITCEGQPQIEAYKRSQRRAAAELGIDYIDRQFTGGEDALISALDSVNLDPDIDGVILHMPLPLDINYFNVIRHLDEKKDVEGICPFNLWMLFAQQTRVVPSTPAAVIRILDESGIEIRGKHAVVIGQGAVVGRPLSMLLLQRQATVTICHLPTYESGKLPDIVAQGDIVISAVGKPRLVKGEWIKRGAAVIDVGINEVDGAIVGDIDFDSAVERAGYITPVPGGVGPVTVAMLMENLLLLCEKKAQAL